MDAAVTLVVVALLSVVEALLASVVASLASVEAAVVAAVVVVVSFVSVEEVAVVAGDASRSIYGASSSRKAATQHSGEFQLMVHSFTDHASTLSR